MGEEFFVLMMTDEPAYTIFIGLLSFFPVSNTFSDFTQDYPTVTNTTAIGNNIYHII